MMEQALWIEDQPHEILEMRRCVEARGLVVTVCGSLESAKPLLQEHFGWKVILLDSYFPRDKGQGAVHSGIILFKDLRAGAYGEWGKAVHVIFETGYKEIVQEATRQQTTPPLGIVSKPADPQDLIDILIKERIL
jgi:CheY-like chemotaxis protein